MAEFSVEKDRLASMMGGCLWGTGKVVDWPVTVGVYLKENGHSFRILHDVCCGTVDEICAELREKLISCGQAYAAAAEVLKIDWAESQKALRSLPDSIGERGRALTCRAVPDSRTFLEGGKTDFHSDNLFDGDKLTQLGDRVAFAMLLGMPKFDLDTVLKLLTVYRAAHPRVQMAEVNADGSPCDQ